MMPPFEYKPAKSYSVRPAMKDLLKGAQERRPAALEELLLRLRSGNLNADERNMFADFLEMTLRPIGAPNQPRNDRTFAKQLAGYLTQVGRAAALNRLERSRLSFDQIETLAQMAGSLADPLHVHKLTTAEVREAMSRRPKSAIVKHTRDNMHAEMDAMLAVDL